MPSGTTLYLTLVFAVLIAVCIPLGLRWVSRFVFSANLRARAQSDPQIEKFAESTPRLNTRFFVGLNSGILVSACLLMIYPLTHLFQNGEHPGTLTRAVILIFFSSLFFGIALVLLQQKKLLKWQGTHSPRFEPAKVDESKGH